MHAGIRRFVLPLLLVSSVLVTVGAVGVGPVSIASVGADDGLESSWCGLRFCPPDPPPPEELLPYIVVTAWSYNAGSGVWEEASAGLPYGGLAGDEYRLLAQLREDDGTLIPDAQVSVQISEFPQYQCEPVDARLGRWSPCSSRRA